MKKILKKRWFRITAIIGILYVIFFIRQLYILNETFRKDAEMAPYAMKALTNPDPESEWEKNFYKIIQGGEHASRGDRYQEEGEYDLAIEEYKKAIELARESRSSAWVEGKDLAGAYEKSGHYDFAIKTINWIMPEANKEGTKELNDWKSRILRLKGDIKIQAKWEHIRAGDNHQKEGLSDLAIGEYNKAYDLAVEEDRKWGGGGSKWLIKKKIAGVYEKAGQYDLAVEEYKKAEALAEAPSKVYIKKSLADIYEKTGRDDLAIKEIDWIISSKSRGFLLKDFVNRRCRLLVRGYEKTGQYALAIKELEERILYESREDVREEFKGMKSRIEKLKAAKAQEGK